MHETKHIDELSDAHARRASKLNMYIQNINEINILLTTLQIIRWASGPWPLGLSVSPSSHCSQLSDLMHDASKLALSRSVAVGPALRVCLPSQ